MHQVTVKLHARTGDYVRNAVLSLPDPDELPAVLTDGPTAYLYSAIASEDSLMPIYLEVPSVSLS